MPWLKRNLILVIGGLVALALLGLAGYFLFSKIKQNDEVTAQLDQTTTELKSLVNRDPHPGTEQVNNIAAAKEEQAKLAAFLRKVKSHFSPPPPTNQLTSRQFRELLDNAINDLKRSAEAAGVQVEKDYWFTFAAQKTSVNFPTNQVGTLALQLADIKALCNVLFDAKVLKLTGIKRVPVTTDDSGTTDYVTTKTTTNNWAIVTPYELAFDSFSSELAEVLEGLLQSRDSFVVRNMTVEKAADAQQTPEQDAQTGMSSADPYGGRYGMNQAMMRRYGLAPRPGMDRYRQTPQPTPTAPTTKPSGRGGLETILDEKSLRVTLQIDSVRLKAR